MNKRVLRMVGLIGIVGASACSANPARVSAEIPLVIPEPPPRVAIEPVAEAEGEAPEPERPATAAPRTPAAAPAATGGAPPAASPPAAAEQPAETPRTAAPPELRPAGPAAATTAANVRESIARTRKKLDAIDRRRLNAGRRADYDSARRFLSQAEGAVRAGNLLLAQSSVEKAETLANGLR